MIGAIGAAMAVMVAIGDPIGDTVAEAEATATRNAASSVDDVAEWLISREGLTELAAQRLAVHLDALMRFGSAEVAAALERAAREKK